MHSFRNIEQKKAIRGDMKPFPTSQSVYVAVLLQSGMQTFTFRRAATLQNFYMQCAVRGRRLHGRDN
jgi:hypothetical protein